MTLIFDLTWVLAEGGLELELTLDESAGKNDEVIEVEGVKFLINKNAASYFQNTKLDYVRNLLGHGEFKLLTM